MLPLLDDDLHSFGSNVVHGKVNEFDGPIDGVHQNFGTVAQNRDLVVATQVDSVAIGKVILDEEGVKLFFFFLG